MEILQGPNVQHVYGYIDEQRGPLLIYQFPWGFTDTIELAQFIAHDETFVQQTIEFAGSKYDVIYSNRDDVEGITVREHWYVSRPIGLGVNGPRVSQLVFTNLEHAGEWRLLEPDEIPVVQNVVVSR